MTTNLSLRVASGDSILPALKALDKPNFAIQVKGTKDFPTGDVGLYDENENLVMLAERKSKSDMISSLTSDGRYTQQICRLRQIQKDSPDAKIGFIIEQNTINQSESTEKVMHAITSIVFKYGFFCIQTPNLEGTAMVVNDAARKIGFEHDDALDALKSAGGTVKMKKKSEYLHENFFAHQLALVNRVSLRIAQAIATKYKTFSALWKAWETSSSPETLLEKVQISTESKKIVGTALSKQIYYHVTGTTIESVIKEKRKKVVKEKPNKKPKV